MRLFWRIAVAVMTLVATVWLSVRSWTTHDIVVFNRGGPGFPSVTCFTVQSCIRAKISDQLHHFNFGQSVSNENGWHTQPVSAQPDGTLLGAFHFIPPLSPQNSAHEIFVGLPISLALIPGYLPLLWWCWRRKRSR